MLQLLLLLLSRCLPGFLSPETPALRAGAGGGQVGDKRVSSQEEVQQGAPEEQQQRNASEVSDQK